MTVLNNTRDTSTSFTGVLGRTYGFQCVATDTAGNVEEQTTVAEAFTKVGNGDLPGDLNKDGKVDCTDLSIVKAAFGKRPGQVGFDARADVNKDGIVDVRDLAFVSQRMPVGTKCL